MGVYINKENYLKALCIAHPDVAHGAVVDGVVRKSFFRINSDEELTSSTVNDIAYPAVAYIHIDGRMTDIENAMVDIRHVFKNGWMFLDHVNTLVDADGIGDADRIQIAFDTTFSIMEDFIKAMKDDFEENGRCGAFENFDLNKINYVQHGPTQQNEYGWVLYFEDAFMATRVISGEDMDTVNWHLTPYRVDPEIIAITNEAVKVFTWTNTRKNKYGAFPSIEVWIQDEAGTLFLSAAQPIIDAGPPDFTTMTFAWEAAKTGFIVIK